MDVNQLYQEFQRSLQKHGLQGFRYVMEIEPRSKQGELEYKVWACVGLMDVRFATFYDSRIYDKYLFIGPCASKNEAKQEAKLRIMKSHLHVYTPGVTTYIDAFL